MKSRRFALVTVLLLSSSVARAAELKVTFYATPEGATLLEEVPPSGAATVATLPKDLTETGLQLFGPLFASRETRTWGTTPITIKYNVPRRWTECIRLRPMSVRWVSGAEASTQELTACPANGKNQQVHFARPTGVPGAEVDAMYAVQLQQLAVLQGQAETARRASVDQWLQQMQQNIQLQQQTWAIQRARQCTSQLIGAFVYTNCF